MASPSILTRFDPARLADHLAVAVAAALPWSTSATSILIVLWLLALVPTLKWDDVRRELATPAGGLPALLVLLGALGMLWADLSLLDRWKGLDSFVKLLMLPLLLVQFRRSDRSLQVLIGYCLSCVTLFLVSTILVFWQPADFRFPHDFGVPVKNAATQSGEFVTCIFGLLFLAIESFERRQWLWLAGLLALVFGMAADILYVAAGRTALVIMPVMLAILAAKKLNGKGILVFIIGAIFFGCIGWFSSPYLRHRTIQIWTDYQNYEATDATNSSGERIEFWRKSVGFVREAPTFGHGTGTIPSLFARSAEGRTGAAASATTNPHNQTFAVAIQLGLVGAGVLWAMWIAHLLLFRGNGMAEWIGLVVVVQNIVGSLFNSHLFDFAQGWVYVFGVGVAGGMVLKHRAAAASGVAARSS